MQRVVALLVRLVIVAGLITDAVIHLRLAHDYQLAQPAGVGQGTLFRVQAGLAIVVAIWVLVRPNRAGFAVAAVTALSALAAVVLYRYVDVPGFGPIPSMYEPLWFGQKTVSAIAEGVAGVTCLGVIVSMRRAAGDRRVRTVTAPVHERRSSP